MTLPPAEPKLFTTMLWDDSWEMVSKAKRRELSVIPLTFLTTSGSLYYTHEIELETREKRCSTYVEYSICTERLAELPVLRRSYGNHLVARQMGKLQGKHTHGS